MTHNISWASPRRQACFLVQGWAVCVLALTAGCSVDNKVGISQDAPVGIGGDDGGPSGPEVSIIVLAEPRTSDGGGICPPLTCGTGATQYCGDFDNCGQIMHCGACPAGAVCTNNVCAGTVCLTGCSVPGGDYCGTIGDGCGGTLNCSSL